jgi:hypothetical protein
MSTRKPHNDFVGYVAELRNPHSGGHTIILDCKLAEKQGEPLVKNYAEEGGRYQVLCNDHSQIVHTTNLPSARECMKDATNFCSLCRCIAGEGGKDWEKTMGLSDHEIEIVRSRRIALRPPAPPEGRKMIATLEEMDQIDEIASRIAPGPRPRRTMWIHHH